MFFIGIQTEGKDEVLDHKLNFYPNLDTKTTHSYDREFLKSLEPEKYEDDQSNKMEFKSKFKFNSIEMGYNPEVFSGMRGRVLFFKSDSTRYSE